TARNGRRTCSGRRHEATVPAGAPLAAPGWSRPACSPGARFFPCEDGRRRLRRRQISLALIPFSHGGRLGGRRRGSALLALGCRAAAAAFATQVRSRRLSPLLLGKSPQQASIQRALFQREKARPAIHASRAQPETFLLFICSSAPKCGAAVSARERGTRPSTTARSG